MEANGRSRKKAKAEAEERGKKVPLLLLVLQGT